MNKNTHHKSIAPYGLWESSTSIEELFNITSHPMYPFQHGNCLYWLEVMVNDGGTTALVKQDKEGQKTRITPMGYNIQTRVNEYGGKCFCLYGDFIIFNNYDDGCLCIQSLLAPSKLEKLESEFSHGRLKGFADLVIDPEEGVLFAVAEYESHTKTIENCIVAVKLPERTQGENSRTAQIILVASGQHFYANVSLSGKNNSIAWFEWSLPNMPWDQSRLVCATYVVTQNHVDIIESTVVVDEPDRSVCQLGFLEDGRLLFASDSNTIPYWNFFVYDGVKTIGITDFDFELGEAHWIFGQSRWQEISNGNVLAVATLADSDQLLEVNLQTGEFEKLPGSYSSCRHLRITENGTLLMIGHYPDRSPELMEWKNISGKWAGTSRITRPAAIPGVSRPELISYPTSDEGISYGFFYRPENASYTGPENTLPPLMVMVHGGPTSRATSEYTPLKQYLCTLGFAVLDVNHRGSTGFGRKFRQSLRGKWGIFDAADIIYGIKYLADRNWVESEQVFIRGSSAGGYAVLRALTLYPEKFAGGASYYGIGNLVTLCEITHKFESGYTDLLVGETYDAKSSDNQDSEFVKRSPVTQFQQLSSPLILFQGLEDRIVPPNLSREVAELLEEKGVEHAYTEYPGEGHGFRKAETRIDAFTREMQFFTKIIKGLVKYVGGT